MRKFRRSILNAVVAGAVAFAFGGAQTASARGWGSHGSSGGSWGSHGSSGGSWGSHGSSGSYGSSGGSYGSYGSGGGSYGSYGSYGSGGGSWGSYGGSYGSYGSAGGYYVTASNVTSAPADTRVAQLIVNVPQDANVYLQDQRMTLTGARRRYVSPALDATPHVYTVKVEVVRDGRTLTKTTKAQVRAGQEVEVTVSFDAKNPNDLVASVMAPASR